jgi:diguanylate cyclase (GGDEF)-like protein
MDELHTARKILEGMADPAVLLDRDLRPLAYNQRFLELTGLRRRQIDERLSAVASPMELVADAGALERQHAAACVSSGKPIRLAEIEVRAASGDRVTVHMTFIPVLALDGRAVGLIEILRDVSADARVQARYRELLAAQRLRAEHLEREVEKRTGELTAALEQVTRLSREDPLTGLLNRRAFTEHGEIALKLARRHDRSAGVLVTDLDHFKRVNDTYGHQTGDAVLVETARLLRRVFRETDVIARFGGEEFVVLLKEPGDETVAVVAERLRESVERHRLGDPFAGVRFPTMSIGIAIFPEHGTSLEALVSHADEALYRAKESGRNRAILYEPTFAKSEHPRTQARPRVLTTCRDGPHVSALSAVYEVIAVESSTAALERCRSENFDVLIGDLSDVDAAVELLRQSLRLRPEALRVLMIDTEDVFVEVRGTNVACVDCFLLRHESASHILDAIDSGLARRDLDRQRTLLATDGLRRAYTARVRELDELIERRQLAIAFQPIVDARTGELRAYEALARARHPVFGDATVLFEAAVRSGNLWRLGRLCREVALATRPDTARGEKLFLNLHPGEIDDPELARWGASMGGPEQVIFEITERAAIPDFRRFRSNARALSEAGFQFAIDDLGAGYASLNAIALLEPAYIKIDMAMIRDIDTSIAKQRLVGRMAQFAEDMGIQIVAEGVESADEARTVADLGCHLAQGFYYGRPREP